MCTWGSCYRKIPLPSPKLENRHSIASLRAPFTLRIQCGCSIPKHSPHSPFRRASNLSRISKENNCSFRTESTVGQLQTCIRNPTWAWFWPPYTTKETEDDGCPSMAYIYTVRCLSNGGTHLGFPFLGSTNLFISVSSRHHSRCPHSTII